MVQCQADLSEIVRTLQARRRRTNSLDRRYEQREEYRDDGDCDEDFDQRKCALP
jgi:hypothetical protein